MNGELEQELAEVRAVWKDESRPRREQDAAYHRMQELYSEMIRRNTARIDQNNLLIVYIWAVALVLVFAGVLYMALVPM